MRNQQTFGFVAAGAKKPARKTVGFRLEDKLQLELCRRAKALGVSHHELARHYVVEMLRESEDRAELRKVVNALCEHVREARKDIALSTEALLISTGTEEKEARTWKERNLYRE